MVIEVALPRCLCFAVHCQPCDIHFCEPSLVREFCKHAAVKGPGVDGGNVSAMLGVIDPLTEDNEAGSP
jgi:hypothetical protein